LLSCNCNLQIKTLTSKVQYLEELVGFKDLEIEEQKLIKEQFEAEVKLLEN